MITVKELISKLKEFDKDWTIRSPNDIIVIKSGENRKGSIDLSTGKVRHEEMQHEKD